MAALSWSEIDPKLNSDTCEIKVLILENYLTDVEIDPKLNSDTCQIVE